MNTYNPGALKAKLATTAAIDNKRVLLRACLNVPLDKSGKITDTTRLDEGMAELARLAKFSKKLIITAHLGRPDGKIVAELSLAPVKMYLEEKLGMPIELLTDINHVVSDPLEYKVTLIENIRFWPEEESKDKEVRMNFAKKLAGFADVYVNNAFPDYREAASTYDVAKLLPSSLGENFLQEVDQLGKFSSPARPFVAVMGGAKLSEKIDVLLALGKTADKVLIGGAMAYTLLVAKGIKIGKSLVETDKVEVAKEILAKYGDKIMLPVDHVAVKEFKEPGSAADYITVDGPEITEDIIAVDIGPKTKELYVKELGTAGSILWNGPMGVFEWQVAGQGTEAVGKAIVANSKAFKLAGGGDSISAIGKYDIHGFDHVSTGGGAMLAFLAYDKFPVLDVILASN